MTSARAVVRCGQAAALALWLATFVGPDSLTLAGTIAGSMILLVGSTEIAYRAISRW